MWAFIAKVTVPRMMKLAMQIAAKGFRDKYKPKIHAMKTRQWMLDHVWQPIIDKMRGSKTKYDDPFIEFVYYNQSLAIEKGTIRYALKTANAEMIQGNLDLAQKALKEIEQSLGLDVDPDGSIFA